MFGLSIGKILVLVAVIVIIWRGGKWLRSIQSSIDRLAKAQEGEDKPAPKRDRVTKRAGAVDLEPCPMCGIYKPAGAFCGGPEACRFKDGTDGRA